MRILGVMLVVSLAPKSTCGTSEKATKEVANSSATNTKVLDVSASQLYADYEENEVSADEKYKDKIVRVTGPIGEIGKDVLDVPYVRFGDVLGVQCMFDEPGGLGALKKGQKITVRCKVDGKMGNVILRGCMIDK